MATLNIRLDDALEMRFAREADLEKCTRSELARTAIETYLTHRERQRFQADILRAAGARGDREAIAVATDALYTDNEALELAQAVVTEPKARYGAKAAKRKKR